MGTSASVANGADAVKDIPQNHPKSSTIKPLGCSKISKKTKNNFWFESSFIAGLFDPRTA